jgi:hypothetical protein
MFTKVKLALWAFAALSLGSMILLGYRHYSGMVRQGQEQAARVAELEVALAVEQEAVRTLQAQAEELQADLKEQGRVAQRASAEARRLNAIFAEHDLTRLALAKPGLVERRVNDGTARVGRVLVCLTTPDCDDGSANAPGPAPTVADPAATATVDDPDRP